MNKDFDLTNLQKIRGNRRFIIELIVFAIVLGLLINLLSSFVVNIFTCEEFQKNFWINLSVGTGIFILLLVAIAILIFCKKQTVEYAEIAPTLAVCVDRNKQKVEFLSHPSYQAAEYSSKLYAYTAGRVDADFSTHWPMRRPFPLSDLIPGHPCWEIIADLVEASLIQLLRQYGQHTLTPSAMFYAEFRRIANALEKTTLLLTHMPIRLRKNVFLNARKAEKILVPERSRFSVNYFGAPEYSNGQYARKLSLITPNGTITFAIAKYWAVLGNQLAASRQFHQADLKRTVFLRIPIDIKFSFSPGFRSLNKVQTYYLWFKKLIDNAQRRMDWGFHLRRSQDLQP